MSTASETNAQLSGARATLNFADGSKYVADPINDRDISEINRWLGEFVIQLAQGSLKSDMKQSERDEVLDAAMRAAPGVTIQSPRGAAILATVDGWARLVWQMIHRNHPGVTVEHLRAAMYDKRNVEEAARTFQRQNVRPDRKNGQRPVNGSRKK